MEDLLGRHFISLALIILFSIWLIVQRVARDKELRYFWLTIVSCFLLILEDQAESFASLDPSLRFWRILFSVAGYFLRSTATVGLVMVVCRPEQRHKAIWIPCAVNLLVCSTAFFSDVAFGYDQDYHFYRGPLGYVSFIVPILYLCAILWLTYRRYGDSGKKKDQLILLPCAFLCLFSGFLDSFYGGVRLHEAIMISSIFFYLFLRSYNIRRDSLTMLMNRQSLYDDCRSLDKSFCAAASMDMIGLKSINSQQGHRAGDLALNTIGSCLLSYPGQNVRAYRIGGDEFVLLFSGMDEISVRQALTKLLKSIQDNGLNISSGYVMREPGEDPESMIRRADMKMFEDKAHYYRDRQHDRRRDRRERTDPSAEEMNRKTLEESPQPVIICRFSNHRVEPLAVSDGYCRLFGYPDRVQAMYVLDSEMYADIHPADEERYSGAVLRFFDGNGDLDIVYRTRAGMESGYRVVHARGSQIYTGSDDTVAYIWYMDEGVYAEGDQDTGSQITNALNRALREESIVHAAHYDGLTGLPNLAWFFQLCEAKNARILSEGDSVHLLYIDLNGMKYFNHRYGFAEGDRLLKAFADALLRIFGKENCCHISADRFAAASSGEKSENRIRRLLEEAAGMNNGKTLPVRVGIYSSAMEDVPVSTAFDRAKEACDAIRLSDASGFNYYNEELRNETRKHQYLVENIDTAISEKWIQVYYQQIVRSSDNTLCDEEALARWLDPVEGFLSPADFVPLLEKAGLIYKLDLCVLDQVLEKIRYLETAGAEVVPQSINLSRSDFDACDIVEEIRRRVDAAGVRRGLITVEITESIIGGDFDFMKEQITRFQELGFSVWMDDFGSGYSPLNVLHSIPFDLIKFDMSFLRKLDKDDRGRIILTEMMGMASSLRVDTVCEGVETEAHAAFLQNIGCTKLQGYYFGQPAPFVPEKG